MTMSKLKRFNAGNYEISGFGGAADLPCGTTPAWRFPSRRTFLVWLLFTAVFAQLASPLAAQTILRDGWKVQSSAKVPDGGDRVSLPGFSAQGWYSTSAPKTVFAVLVESGVYKDPYYGMNLRDFPGMEYNIGSQFANQEMPANSPYAVPWWYRSELDVPAADMG
jgi:exo-1,4-beta-D-glucosaminidase